MTPRVDKLSQDPKSFRLAKDAIEAFKKQDPLFSQFLEETGRLIACEEVQV
jgi:hypothetical protein